MQTSKDKTTQITATRPYIIPKYKRFPAYGKKLMGQRLAGQVPTNSVVAAFDWNISGIFPRIVIADDVQPENLVLRYLAGLDVMLAFNNKDANRVMRLGQEILNVNPRSLLIFAIDIPKNTILENIAGEVMV